MFEQKNEFYDYLIRIENIGKAITHHPIQVIFEQDISSRIAYTDGSRCIINTANLISGSFISKEDYLDSLYGLAFHEFGHIIIPNLQERKLWTYKLSEGYLEINMPDTMEEALTDNNRTFRELTIHLLIQIGYFLHNVLDDIYIESKIKKLYPGICKKTIELNRERFNYLTEKQMNKNVFEIDTICNLFLFYSSSSGRRIEKEEYNEIYHKLDSILSNVPNMIKTEKDAERWSFINKILVLYWPEIKIKLDTYKQYQEKSIIKILNKDVKPKSFQLEPTPTNVEIGNDIIQIATLLKELSNQKFNEKNTVNTRLQKEASHIDYGKNNELIRILAASPEIQTYMPIQYEIIKKEMEESIKRLSQLIQKIKQGKGSKQKGQYVGKRISTKSIYRPDKRIFLNQNNPRHKKMAIVLLIDESTSMDNENRIEYARKAAIFLYEVCDRCHIPLAIYGHNTNTNTVQIDVFVEFSHIENEKYRIMAMTVDGANRDGMAVRYAGDILSKRNEEIKLLILISDGRPNHQDYHREKAKQDLIEAKVQLQSKGISLFTAAIGEDKQQIEEIYGSGYLDISDIRTLPECLMNLIINYI